MLKCRNELTVGKIMTFSIPPVQNGNAFAALRLFCCSIVIAMHILDLSGTKSILRPFFDGHVAVCVFFILSGFWVTKSFLSSTDLKSYVAKRMKRILPLYYISIGGGGTCIFICERAFVESVFLQY